MRKIQFLLTTIMLMVLVASHDAVSSSLPHRNLPISEGSFEWVDEYLASRNINVTYPSELSMTLVLPMETENKTFLDLIYPDIFTWMSLQANEKSLNRYQQYLSEELISLFSIYLTDLFYPQYEGEAEVEVIAEMETAANMTGIEWMHQLAMADENIEILNETDYSITLRRQPKESTFAPVTKMLELVGWRMRKDGGHEEATRNIRTMAIYLIELEMLNLKKILDINEDSKWLDIIKRDKQAGDDPNLLIDEDELEASNDFDSEQFVEKELTRKKRQASNQQNQPQNGQNQPQNQQNQPQNQQNQPQNGQNQPQNQQNGQNQPQNQQNQPQNGQNQPQNGQNQPQNQQNGQNQPQNQQNQPQNGQNQPQDGQNQPQNQQNGQNIPQNQQNQPQYGQNQPQNGQNQPWNQPQNGNQNGQQPNNQWQSQSQNQFQSSNGQQSQRNQQSQTQTQRQSQNQGQDQGMEPGRLPLSRLFEDSRSYPSTTRSPMRNSYPEDDWLSMPSASSSPYDSKASNNHHHHHNRGGYYSNYRPSSGFYGFHNHFSPSYHNYRGNRFRPYYSMPLTKSGLSFEASLKMRDLIGQLVKEFKVEGKKFLGPDSEDKMKALFLTYMFKVYDDYN